MNRDLAIGTAISLLLHGMLAYWASTLPQTHTLGPIEPKKLVRTVQEQIVLPKKPRPELPKIEPPKPEPAVQARTETPEPVAKPAPKPRSEASKPQAQKPSEPAPLVLSKTYGASDGSGVAVNAGKDDTLGDPNVDPDENNTRQRFAPKIDAPTHGGASGDGVATGGHEVKIVHAVRAHAFSVDWPEGAEASGRTIEVTLLLEISEEGVVDKVRVLRGAGEPFDSQAIAALKQQKFKPGTRDGKPFRDSVSFAVEFKPAR